MTNTATGEVGSHSYPVLIRLRTLALEKGIAVDEGLWYLHKVQRRYQASGVDYGDWWSASDGVATSPYYSISALNLNGFGANGHKEGGDADDPYTETVQRCMRALFSWLEAFSLSGTQSYSSNRNLYCTLNQDSNGNGIGIMPPSQDGDMRPYQSGMFMDAIIACGSPDTFATTGMTNVLGKKYRDIMQDMVDAYAWAQYDYYPYGGGWRYVPNDSRGPDNSACQWAAIGMIPAEGTNSSPAWNCMVPACLKEWNLVWLKYSQASDGHFGYDGTGCSSWGCLATTASGLVQLALDNVGRDMMLPGETNMLRWNMAESYLYEGFKTTARGCTANIKDYYYGLLSFCKAMWYHNTNGNLTPITWLQHTPANASYPPIDWYWDETYGVVRTLVGDQDGNGYWYGHDCGSQQFKMDTGMALIMLSRLTAHPVAVIKVVPNPGLTNEVITFDGSLSYHLSDTNVIIRWDWDLNNDGTNDASGPIVSKSWPTPGTNRVWLQVTDDVGVIDRTFADVVIMPPPVPPTANAGYGYASARSRSHGISTEAGQ